MTLTQLKILIKTSAQNYGVNTAIALAIAEQESDYNEKAMRYEANWKYIVTDKKLVKELRITLATELQLQKFSYGMFQIMGSVARELGFKGMLTDLLDPIVNVTYGVRKIRLLAEKHPTIEEYVSAYNAGEGGIGTNPDYVKSVLDKASKN